MFRLEQITSSGRRIVENTSEAPIVNAFFSTRATLGACGVPFTLAVIGNDGKVIEFADSED